MMGEKKQKIDIYIYITFTKNKSKLFQGIAGPKTVVEGFPARRGLSGLPANRMTAKKLPGTWALALWKTKTLTTTCQHSKKKGIGQHKVTSSCISLHFSFMISMQEIPRNPKNLISMVNPLCLRGTSCGMGSGKGKTAGTLLKLPAILRQNTREHHPRGQILCCRHVRLGSWASRKTSPSCFFFGGAKRFVLAAGLDGGTEGPLGIGDPLRPSPVIFSQRSSF